MNEESVSREMQRIDANDLEQVCSVLKQHDGNILEYVARYVASLCDVSYEKMMGVKSDIHSSQCRWFFWYTYRYMTKETYTKMAERLCKHGSCFTPSGIICGVNKMSILIDGDTVWKKRWVIMKRIISMYNSTTLTDMPEFKEQTRIKMVVYKPSNVTVEVEFKNER